MRAHILLLLCIITFVSACQSQTDYKVGPDLFEVQSAEYLDSESGRFLITVIAKDYPLDFMVKDELGNICHANACAKDVCSLGSCRGADGGKFYAPFRLNRSTDHELQICLQDTDYCETISVLADSSEVTISADKRVYSQGEVMRITARTNKPGILYYGGGDRFWDVEYLESGVWKLLGLELKGFQLTNKELGDACYLLAYERASPVVLNSSITAEWNQKVCPFGDGDFDQPRDVEYIKRGKYRLSFNYGLKVDEQDPYKIKDYETTYSDVIEIK